jgi:hypothetical protein
VTHELPERRIESCKRERVRVDSGSAGSSGAAGEPDSATPACDASLLRGSGANSGAGDSQL